MSGLFFQDKGTSGLQVDPVLIAGLPALEPENLLAKIPEDVLSVPEPGELLRTMREGPMAGVDRIVFAERICGFDHWYANFGFYSASVAEYPPQRGIEGEEIPPLFGDGGRLCLFDLNTKQRTVILEDPTGGIRDPQVDYDGRKILFSYRRGGQPYYHLYEIGTDGTGLTQLTDGPYDDIEPTYLPDGGIVFSVVLQPLEPIRELLPHVGGTFTLSRILGTVPVEPDGSAYVELPARRPLFFVALDDAGLSVKRMQSFVSVEPGEVTGCVGCHEQRLQAPLLKFGQRAFLGRRPSPIEPIGDIPDVFDFPRDVQPIFDRHCVECHNPDRRDGRVDLCGDHTPLFSVSFWNLMRHGLVADGRNERYGNRPPRSIGSSASQLLKFLDGSHYDARLSERDRRLLRLWIDSSAVYAGTYAALGSGMFPVEFPMSVMERRCGDCHGHEPPANPIGPGRYFRFGETGPPLPLVHEFTDLQQIRGRIGYYKFGNARPPQSLCNLSRPDKSLLLRAPLSRDAGGLGLCGPAVFTDTSDADYRAILAKILVAKERHDAEKRFDMPGFRPNVYYVRKMQEYGILPADLKADAPIDIRAVDEVYWRSFWCGTDATR